MPSNKNDWVCIEDVNLIRSTDKAGLYRIDGEDVWIPFSQLSDQHDCCDRDGDSGDIWVRRWFAVKAELEWQDEEGE